jgi:hypothetical protein
MSALRHRTSLHAPTPRLEALEDAQWGQRARAAAREGFVGPEESGKLLTDLLDAED